VLEVVALRAKPDNTGATRNDPGCPADTCPPSETCCSIGFGQYGCCNFDNGNCCEDHQHCCPEDYDCDEKARSCVHHNQTLLRGNALARGGPRKTLPLKKLLKL
jgi:hypothetical protein